MKNLRKHNASTIPQQEHLTKLQQHPCTVWQPERLKKLPEHVHSVATRASEKNTRTCAQLGNKSV